MDTPIVDFVRSYAQSGTARLHMPGHKGFGELGCEALVVSNFTLYGDTKKGKRPSFIAAAKPPLSVEAYEAFVAELRKTGLARVETGEFGADMKVTLTNDGPVTIVIDTDEWKR